MSDIVYLVILYHVLWRFKTSTRLFTLNTRSLGHVYRSVGHDNVCCCLHWLHTLQDTFIGHWVMTDRCIGYSALHLEHYKTGYSWQHIVMKVGVLNLNKLHVSFTITGVGFEVLVCLNINYNVYSGLRKCYPIMYLISGRYRFIVFT